MSVDRSFVADPELRTARFEIAATDSSAACSATPGECTALVAADFNGDRHADLAIGIPFQNGSGVDDSGAVGVLYDSTAGLQGLHSQEWTQDRDRVDGVARTNDRFGSALGAGDFDGNYRADLVVGVPGEELGTHGAIGAGAVNVIEGSPSGLTSSGDQIWHQNR